MGLERAGWRTVSFSEIDLYASAVLAERWPGVPNLGDITAVSDSCRRVDGEAAARIPDTDCPVAGHDGSFRIGSGRDVGGATLWTGGFPCQDLSVAGKRRGMGTEDDRTRSGLAYAFLDLVERHRPPAILLENVPGLLSSNGGKDFGALLGRLAELGYWWAYRILDAQFFGVPQRRRRVFICALHAGAGFGADSPAAVLSVGARCDGHSAASDEAGEGAAESPEPSPVVALQDGRAIDKRQNGDGWNASGVAYTVDGTGAQSVLRPSPDPGGVRAAYGLAGRSHDQREVVNPILAGGNGGQRTTDLNTPLVYRKSARVNSDTSPGTWVDDGLANTLNSFDVGDIRTTHLALRPTPERDAAGLELDADSLLPLGLDSHRYRCCGNGVVSNVSEWIGVRLARVMA
jgi:DNA (cytosine-5)-methyltransferase 1